MELLLGGLEIGWGALATVLGLALAALLLRLLLGGLATSSGSGPEAARILTRRYALGEIDRDTYLRMREDLSRETGAPPR